MKRSTLLGAVGSVAAIAALAGSCHTGNTGSDPVAADAGPAVPTHCRADCQTDLAAARAALVSNDYQKAFELYRCADTPEAAFGAGLTRVLLAAEGNNADAVMADFGQPPLAARDLVGPNGYLARAQARWQGQGSVTLSGDVTAALTFDRALQEVPTASSSSGSAYSTFSAEDTSENQASLSMDFVSPSPSGTALTDGAVLAVSFNCASTTPSRTIDPRLNWVDVSFSPAAGGYSCTLPYSLTTAQCQTDGGSILVNSAATAVGAQASYTLQNLLMACTPKTSEGEATAPISTTPQTQTLVRVSGTVSAKAVSENVDVSGLHPLFAEDFSLAAAIPADRKVTDLVRHAGAAAEELAEAGCFWQLAAEGTGTIFNLPGALYGGRDMPVSKGDTQVLAAFAYLWAGAGHLATAYEIDMPLRQLVCESSSTGGAPSTCPSDQEMTSAFNAAFASAFHGEEFAAAQSLTSVGLPLLDAGLGNLDANSVLVNNGVSAAGLTVMRDFVHAVVQSLTAKTPLPHVTPQITLDLGAFFAGRKNPKSVNQPVLVYEETCSTSGNTSSCSSGTNFNSAFLSQYFAESVGGVDWENGNYQWDNDEAVSDAFEEFGRRLEPYLLGKN